MSISHQPGTSATSGHVSQGSAVGIFGVRDTNVSSSRVRSVRRGASPSERTGGRGAPARGAERPALGKLRIAEHPQVTASDRRDSRLWLRKTLWEISTLDRAKGCGCRRQGATSDVPVRWTENVHAGLAGLQSCGSVWVCPVCAAKVAAHRSEEVGGALKTHLDQGKSIVFVTLTVRHHRGQALSEVWDVVSKAWAAVHRTAAWRGSRKVEGDKARFGIRGWVRAVEVTHGDAGWHVHTHVAVLVNRELTSDERDTLGARMFDRWSRACVRGGFEAPTEAHGVDVRQVSPGAGAAQAIGRYLVKTGLDGLAGEITGGAAKAARGGNRALFQVLADIKAAKDGGADCEGDLRIWREWEAGSHGRRQISWSGGLRDDLRLGEELSDREIAEEEKDGYLVGAIPSEHWKKARIDIAMRCQLFREVERAKTPEQAATAVRVVLTEHGYAAVDMAVQKIETSSPPTREQKRVDSERQARVLLR